MSLAYATKDQMKVWKCTSKPGKDYPERATDRVTLHIRADKENGGYIAQLLATDGYQAVVRNIQAEAGAEEIKTSIPREAVEKAEKVMKSGDRAYFSENKITVIEVSDDDNTGIENLRTIAQIPYVEQMDMFIDLDTALQKAIKSDIDEKKVIVDAAVLKKAVEQLKHGDEHVYVTLSFRGNPNDMQPLVMTAFEAMETYEITAAVMPVRS